MPSAGFGKAAITWQCLLMVVFIFAQDKNVAYHWEAQMDYYTFYLGVACMMFAGFGYIGAHLKGYGLGSVGFTMLIVCLVLQWALLLETLMGRLNLDLDFEGMLNACFAAVAALISFGGVMGRVSPSQILVLAIIEPLFYCVNKVFVLGQYDIFVNFHDRGGSVIVHVFGACFGNAACLMLADAKAQGGRTRLIASASGQFFDRDMRNALKGTYNSDLFALMGTVFLWIFWPSFAAGTINDKVVRFAALVNTVLALMASTTTTFGVTPLLEKSTRFGPAAIRSATLAGGIAIGATADSVAPCGALLIGGAAGLLVSYALHGKSFVMKPMDTRGVGIVHGLPGIFGGLVSVIVPFMSSAVDDPYRQALVQAGGLCSTIAIAAVSGALTGSLMNCVDVARDGFKDSTWWECAES